MKTNYLFPHRFRLLYLIGFSTSLALLLSMLYIEYLDESEITYNILHYFGLPKVVRPIFPSLFYQLYADEILIVTCITSGLMYAFSREKSEDEMVMAIRLSSLAWASILNYLIIMITYIVVYGGEIFYLIYSSLLSQLIIFIFLFGYNMYRFYNTLQNEE